MTNGRTHALGLRGSHPVFQWNSRLLADESIDRLSLGRACIMSDKQHKVSGEQVDVKLMPDEVQRLVEIMHGVNPDWNLEDWLSEQASSMLELIHADLHRERLVIEQRLHRLQAIQGRFEKEATHDIHPNQRNIFDCFELEIDSSLKGLGQRTAASEDLSQTSSQHEETMHPAQNVLEFLPGDENDDPLLAVVCQMLLIHVETEIGKGSPCATLESIFKDLHSKGISPEEIDEALDHSLMNGSLLEIDDDCFVSTT